MEYTTKHDIAITISCAKFLKKYQKIILCMTLRSDFKIRFQNGIKCRNTSMDSGFNVPERVLRCTYVSIVVIRRCWRLTFFKSFIAWCVNYNAVVMGAMASQITSLVNVYTIVYSWGRLKKAPNLRVTGLCEGNSPVTGEFTAPKASDAEKASIWWRNHSLHEVCLLVNPFACGRFVAAICGCCSSLIRH